MTGSPTTSPDPQGGPSPLPPGGGRGLGPWPLRVVWLVLPLTVGAVVADVLDGRSPAVGLVAAGLAWAAWAVSLLATYVAHPLGLTALRIAGPTVLAGTLVATIAARPAAAIAALAIVTSVAAATLALHPETADRCVDGASYGPEQRVALRIPLSLLVGPLPLAWSAAVAGTVVGPLLLAARQWVAGAALTVIGLAVAALAVRSIHGLSNRFIVLVPAGFVLHDRAALQDPVLFSRHSVAAVGPARLDTTALDLTLGAAGLVVEARLQQRLDLPVRTGRNETEMTGADGVLFCPLRPGRFLTLATAHGLPVG